MAEFIKVIDIAKKYKMGDVDFPALKGVSLAIDRGEFVAIMGPSGSGKSTFMNILGCLDVPTDGKYFLEGQEVGSLDKDDLAVIRNKKIGFVFQSFNLLARISAIENVELPLLYNGLSSKDRLQRGIAVLSAVGLKGKEYHRPNQLSGGEQQRVAIARALVNNPSIILADEPTGNLDSQTSAELMTLFKQLNKEKHITIVMVTHEADIASYADRRVCFKDGEIIKDECQ